MEVAANKGLPVGRVDRWRVDSNPQASHPNDTTLSFWPPSVAYPPDNWISRSEIINHHEIWWHQDFPTVLIDIWSWTVIERHCWEHGTLGAAYLDYSVSGRLNTPPKRCSSCRQHSRTVPLSKRRSHDQRSLFEDCTVNIRSRIAPRCHFHWLAKLKFIRHLVSIVDTLERWVSQFRRVK